MTKKKKKKDVSPAVIKLSLQERHKRVWEALFYSHQRIDTLLIAISGAGIYVSLETVKYFSTKNQPVDILLKISAALLLIAIISNFFSQWCAGRVHYNDYCISTIDFTCEEDKRDRSEYLNEIQNHECKIRVYEKADNILSILSIILMTLGLGGITGFFIFIF